MIKTYLKLFYPGSFVSESFVKEVEKREYRPEIPSGVYAWQYFERESTYLNGELLLGEPKNFSGTFYIGQELTAKEVIAEYGESSVAAQNIINNGYERVVKTRRNQLFPLGAKDMVVS